MYYFQIILFHDNIIPKFKLIIYKTYHDIIIPFHFLII